MPFDQQRENGSQNVVRIYKHRNISTSGGRMQCRSVQNMDIRGVNILNKKNNSTIVSKNLFSFSDSPLPLLRS